MADKHYGLTNKPNAGVKDNAPDWMNDFFNKQMTKTASTKKANPFEGVNDPILNPTKAGVREASSVVCSKCGKELKQTDVDVCEACVE